MLSLPNILQFFYLLSHSYSFQFVRSVPRTVLPTDPWPPVTRCTSTSSSVEPTSRTFASASRRNLSRPFRAVSPTILPSSSIRHPLRLEGLCPASRQAATGRSAHLWVVEGMSDTTYLSRVSYSLLPIMSLRLKSMNKDSNKV